jgi:hypothetical protein
MLSRASLTSSPVGAPSNEGAPEGFLWVKAHRSEALESADAGILTIAPAFVLILGLILYPVAYSIWLSLLE